MSKQRREVKKVEKVLDSASDDEDVQDEGSMDEDSTEEVRGNGAVIPADKNPRVTKKNNSELKDSLDKNEGSDESLSEEEVKESESDNDSDPLPLSKGKKRLRTTPNKKAKGGRSNKEVSEVEVEEESKASREKLQNTLPKCTVKMDQSKQKSTGKDQSSEEDESDRKEDEGNSDDGGSVPQPRQKKRKIAQKEPRKSTKAEDSDESMKEDDEGTDEEGQHNRKKSAKGKGSKPTRRSKTKTSKEEESENEENDVLSDSGSVGSSKNLRSDSLSESSEDDYKPGRNTASQPRKGAGRARGRGAWRGRARGRGRGRGGARRYEPSDDEDDVKASTSFQRTPRGRSRRQRHSDSEEEKSLCGSGMSSSNSRPAGTAELLCELCRVFYTQGWVTGTGGGISIKDGKIIYVAPSGVQKERLEPEDLFQLNLKGEIVTPPRDTALKCSQCTPLFMLAYKLRNAGAVIHSHSKHAVLATLITKGKEFTTTHLEMIKGVRDASTGKALRYDDRLVVPIIDNTPFEADLAESMEQALVQYPACNAVLVRRHGVYVWGDTWQAAKSMAESYNYLFEVAVDMHRLKLDYTAPPSIPAEVEANGK